MFDQAGRVFIHPSSVLVSESGFRSGFLVYFSQAETSKVFLRDATEVSTETFPQSVRLNLGFTRYRSMVSCYLGVRSQSIIGQVASSSVRMDTSRCVPGRGLACYALNYGELKPGKAVWQLTLTYLLRRLLDAQLAEQIESPHAADLTGHEEVTGAMMALLARDGLSS